MDDLYKYDSKSIGSKGLVFIGDKVLVYRRDTKTDIHPLELDLPGGGPEGRETPFETFKREVCEEFGLTIEPADIVYARRYPSTMRPGMSAYFPVAKLPSDTETLIKLGDEGLEFLLMPIMEYVARTDAWPIFQARAVDYMESLSMR